MENTMSTKKEQRLKAMGIDPNPPRKLSVMQALETAVLLMEQAGETEEDIIKYVHLIHLGLIRDGALTQEYLQLAAQAQQMRRTVDTPPQ
jgi:hypothetical protein